MRTIAIDFESFFSKKLHYSLKGMIVDQYVNHPLFDAYLVSVSDGKQCWAGSPKDFTWSALEDATLISHNARFDKTVYERLVELGIAPKINYADWFCSADLTSFLCNRRSLDQAVEHLLKIKLSKQVRADADNKKWPNDFTPEQQAAMLKYARDDAGYTWLLWDKFNHLWPDHERRISNMNRDQGKYGVQIDTKLLNDYLLWTHEAKLTTEKMLPWLSDDESEDWEEFDVKPTATKCIAEACQRAGIPCPPVKSKEGEDAFNEWEALYGKTHPWIPALSSWRSINRLYGTFQLMKERLRNDGTLPFGTKYFAAHTGRFGGESKINFLNFRKKPIVINERGLMETDEKRIDAGTDGWAKHIIDTRSLVIPRPGKTMIISDLSQIEARCILWLAGDKKTLDIISTGVSIYQAYAQATLDWKGTNLKKEDPDLYAECKAKILACNYGCAWEKFIEMAALYTGVDVTVGDPEFVEEPHPATGELRKVSGWGQRAKQIVAEYRSQNPLITGLWSKLDSAFRQSVGNDFVMGIPSGRKMRYEQVRCQAKIVIDEETGKPRRKTTYTAGIGNRRFESYGGKLTENICQAFARDVFVDGLLRLEKAGHRILFHVHDEAVLECDAGTDPKEIERLMSVTPDWCPGLPLGAEAIISDHYKK